MGDLERGSADAREREEVRLRLLQDGKGQDARTRGEVDDPAVCAHGARLPGVCRV